MAADAVLNRVPNLRDAWDILRFPDSHAGGALAVVIVSGLEVSPGICVGVLGAKGCSFFPAAKHLSYLRADGAPHFTGGILHTMEVSVETLLLQPEILARYHDIDQPLTGPGKRVEPIEDA